VRVFFSVGFESNSVELASHSVAFKYSGSVVAFQDVTLA
jgi:hypothetical protein